MPNMYIRPIAAALASAALLTVACQEPTSLTRDGVPQPRFTSVPGTELLECPFPVASVTMATVGPSGGTVSAGGSSIRIPSRALLQPTLITVATGTSDYVDVDITAGNAEHFQFERPVTITIAYDRCSAASTESEELGAWYVDSYTKAPIAPMDATDDKSARAVSFDTDHLSSYAVAH